MRVAFLTDNYMHGWQVLDPFRVELLKEFTRRSADLLFIQASDYMDINGVFYDDAKRQHVLNEITRFKPDLVFSLNRAGLSPFVCAEISCPVVSWYIDNPNRFSPTLRRFKRDELVFCATRYMMSWLHKHTPSTPEESYRCDYLPFCTNSKIFSPGSGKIPDSEMCDISFVGTLWDPSHLCHIIDNDIDSDERKAFISDVFERYLKDYDLNLHAELARTTGPKLPPPTALKNLFDDFVSTQKRLAVLDALSDFNLEVYGTRTWVGQALARSKKFFDRIHLQPIEDPRDLAQLYRRSRIGLSIAHQQAQSGFPIRIFDIMAVGIPLLSDPHSELNELFAEGEMFMSYQSSAHALEIVNQLLRDPAKRLSMGRAASAEANAHHTFAHRVSTILGSSNTESLKSLRIVSDYLKIDFLHDFLRHGDARIEVSRLRIPNQLDWKEAWRQDKVPVRGGKLGRACLMVGAVAMTLWRGVVLRLDKLSIKTHAADDPTVSEVTPAKKIGPWHAFRLALDNYYVRNQILNTQMEYHIQKSRLLEFDADRSRT